MDLEGRTYLITGANTGIGRETARALSKRGAKVFIATRSEAKTKPVIDGIAAETGQPDKLRWLALDLGDLGSVHDCAEAFLRTGEPLHGLINNAGLAGVRGLTNSGFEMAFGTNHVGHFLLTSLLLDRLRESAPSRIVVVSSDAHSGAKGIDWERVRRPTRTVTGFPEYAVSKLANLLHAQELARRLDADGVTAYALHPGVIASDIWRRVPWPVRPLIKRAMKTPEQGAQTSLYCATSPEVATETGQYYENCERRPAASVATPELAAELWDRCSAWLQAA
jgi:NAD(P)-dependent dehydrogenase (short-subunit alcohol dehydrogenase family)